LLAKRKKKEMESSKNRGSRGAPEECLGKCCNKDGIDETILRGETMGEGVE